MLVSLDTLLLIIVVLLPQPPSTKAGGTMNKCDKSYCQPTTFPWLIDSVAKGDGEKQWRRCCNFHLIRVAWAGDAHMVGLSFTSKSGSENNARAESRSTSKTVSLSNVTKHFDLSKGFVLVLLLKSTESGGGTSSHNCVVSLGKERLNQTFSIAQENIEVALGPFQLHEVEFPLITSGCTYNQVMSHVLFCKPSCHILVLPVRNTEHIVRCLCVSPYLFTVKNYIVSIDLALVWLISLLALLMIRCCRPSFTEPEVQVLLVSCSIKTAIHQYEATFRVGCPTSRLDLSKTVIDIELLGPDFEVIGCPVRFDCSRLIDEICSELRCLIGKYNPMHRVNAIRAHHSGPAGQNIFLFDFYFRELSTEAVLQRVDINRYLTNVPTVMRFRKTNEEAEEVADITGRIDVETPRLPKTRFTGTELCFLFHLALLYGTALVTLFHVPPSKRETGLAAPKLNWLESLLNTLLVHTLMAYPGDKFFGAICIAFAALTLTVLFLHSASIIYRVIKRRHYYGKYFMPQSRFAYHLVPHFCLAVCILLSLALTFYQWRKSELLNTRSAYFWHGSLVILLLPIYIYWWCKPWTGEQEFFN